MAWKYMACHIKKFHPGHTCVDQQKRFRSCNFNSQSIWLNTAFQMYNHFFLFLLLTIFVSNLGLVLAFKVDIFKIFRFQIRLGVTLQIKKYSKCKMDPYNFSGFAFGSIFSKCWDLDNLWNDNLKSWNEVQLQHYCRLLAWVIQNLTNNYS